MGSARIACVERSMSLHDGSLHARGAIFNVRFSRHTSCGNGVESTSACRGNRLRGNRSRLCVSNEDGCVAAGTDSASGLSLQTTVRPRSVLHRRAGAFHIERMDDLGVGTHRGHFSDPVLLYYTDYFGFYKINVEWRDIPSLVGINFPYLQGSFTLALPQWPRPIALAGIITAAVSLVGTVRLLIKTGFLHAAAFGVVYMLELLAWHFPPSGRFLFPLFPFLVAGFASEVCFAIDLVRKALSTRWDVVGRVICSVALGSMLVGVVLTSWETARTMTMHDLSDFRRDTANRRAAYAWINKNLPTDAKFAAYDDVGLYLYTGRQGIRNQVMSRPYILAEMERIKKPIAAMGDFARQHGLAYLLWSPDDYAIDSVLQDADLREQLLARNTGLRLVYNAQNVRVYRVE